MSLGLAAQVDAAALVIAALVPTTGTSTFTRIGGALPLAREPRASDRRFEVQPDFTAGVVDLAFSTSEIQYLGGLVVEIRYDSKAQRETLVTKIAEDTEQIVRALELASAYASGVQRITYTGGTVETDGDAHFVRRMLSFEVLYRRTFDAAADSYVALVAQGLRFADNVTPAGAVNGVNAAFTAPYTPTPATSLRIEVNGVGQDDFTLSGATATFGAASIPQTGDVVRAWFRYVGDA